MSPLKFVEQKITVDELRTAAQEIFGDFVKAVVDIERGIMAVGVEMHADAEQFLLEHGSEKNDLWGINIFPQKKDDDWIMFDSMINIRPSQGNQSRYVEDENTRKKILEVVHRLIA